VSALALAAWGALTAAACWLMGTTWSAPLWERLPLLPLVQFPWRFYGPLALGLAVATGAIVSAASGGRGVAWGVRLTAVALVGLLAWGALAGRPVKLGQEPAHDVDERMLAAFEYDRYGAGTTSSGEFLPRSVSWADYAPGVRRGIQVYEVAYPQAGWQAGLVRVIQGRADVTRVHSRDGWILAGVKAETPATIAFHQLYFPGWRAYLDGSPVAVGPAPFDERLQASLGFMVVDVPPGRHDVEVRLGATPVRLVATAISAGALAGLAVWTLSWWPTRRQGRARLSGVGRALLAAAAIAGAAGCTAATSRLGARPQPALPQTARVVLDIAGLVAESRAETRSPIGAGSGALPPFVDVGRMEIAGEERRWLYLHPPAEVAVRLRVPANAYLQAGLGLDPTTWLTPTGDGVRFIVEAETASARRRLLDRHVNPRARSEERLWLDEWVSLRELEGQEVRLILRTDPAQDPTFDWAGWANPQVVIWDGARPHPGTPHRW
jgi:hypothetical protein